MPPNDAGAVPGSDGNAGATSGNGGVDVEAIVSKAINDALNKAVPAIVKRSLESALPRMLESAAGRTGGDGQQAVADEAPAAGNGAAQGDRVTLKALNETVEGLRRQLKAEQDRATAAEAKSRDTRLRSEVRAAIAAELGESGAHMVDPLMASLHDVGKRFDLDESGAPVASFKRDWGEEKVPLAKAIAEMRAGELKPYLPARNGGLPPSQVAGRGQPARPGQPAPAQGRAFFMDAMLNEVGKDRPELAASLEQQAPRQG